MSTPSNDIVSLTTDAFDTAVAGENTTLVDFWAPWCGPCRQQLPILEKFAADAPEGVTVAKVNIDDEPAVAQKLGIRSIPTLMAFRKGEEVARHVGLASPAKLQELVG